MNLSWQFVAQCAELGPRFQRMSVSMTRNPTSCPTAVDTLEISRRFFPDHFETFRLSEILESSIISVIELDSLILSARVF